MDIKELDRPENARAVEAAAASRGFETVEAFVIDVVMGAAKPFTANADATAATPRKLADFQRGMERIRQLAVHAGPNVDDSRDGIYPDPDEL